LAYHVIDFRKRSGDGAFRDSSAKERARSGFVLARRFDITLNATNLGLRKKPTAILGNSCHYCGARTSPHHWFLIASHSPHHLLETGLRMCPAEKSRDSDPFSTKQSVLCSPV